MPLRKWQEVQAVSWLLMTNGDRPNDDSLGARTQSDPTGAADQELTGSESHLEPGEGARMILFRTEEGVDARLEVQLWHPLNERRACEAWVVSWFDQTASGMSLLKAPVEAPAKPASSRARKEALVHAACDAIRRGPRPPAPRTPPLPQRPTYAERFRQAELVIDAWDRANGYLGRVLRGEEATAFDLYIALSDVLARTYTVNRTLQGMWTDIPIDIREDASVTADERAVRAIDHNRNVLAGSREYDPRADVSFDAYFARQQSGRPYGHWTGHLLSGALQEGFFDGLSWVRGQTTYRGVTQPLELWQYEDGVEPRWKWKESAAITVDLRSNRDQRMNYDRLVARGDVAGLFSHLLLLFWDAKWSLRKLLRRGDLRRPGLVRS